MKQQTLACAFLFGSALFVCLAYTLHRSTTPQPVTFYIVAPTYNNEEWCLAHLASVYTQTYPHWKMVIINDCSTDATSRLLHQAVLDKKLANKVLIVDNPRRLGACQNIYDAVHGCNDEATHLLPACPDEWVVAVLDGDDRYAHPYALARVAREYSQQSPSIWMTYGNYQATTPDVVSICAPLPAYVQANRLFREYRWVTSHHRTYKAWLLKKIKKEDLLYNGEFLPTTCDLAFSFPALEMASNHHIAFIPEVIYIYNTDTHNDYKEQLNKLLFFERIIRGRPRYPVL